MRENRLSGSEGGATPIQSSLPLSISLSLRDKSHSPIEGLRVILSLWEGFLATIA